MANGIRNIAIGIVLATCIVGLKAQATVNCTQTGPGRFPNPSDTTCQNYTYCVYNANTASYLSYNYVCPTTSVFNPASAQCTAPANYVCNVTTTIPATSVCTTDGFVADPSVTNCSSYINCVNINGAFIQTTFECPTGLFYNPATTNCEATYICPSTAFTCSTAGRFANPADTTCQSYYLCALATNGTFLEYQYQCPSTSVFSPTSGFCTTAYICPT